MARIERINTSLRHRMAPQQCCNLRLVAASMDLLSMVYPLFMSGATTLLLVSRW